MHFLDKIKSGALMALRVALPLLSAARFTTEPDLFGGLIGYVSLAEMIGEVVIDNKGSKVDKLALIAPQVESLLLNSPFFKEHTPQNPLEFKAATADLINCAVRLLKSVN